jgi:hypothetical protein
LGDRQIVAIGLDCDDPAPVAGDPGHDQSDDRLVPTEIEHERATLEAEVAKHPDFLGLNQVLVIPARGQGILYRDSQRKLAIAVLDDSSGIRGDELLGSAGDGRPPNDEWRQWGHACTGDTNPSA